MKITKEGFAIVERDTHIGKWVEQYGRLDFDQNALPRYLPFFKQGDVLLNIGANIGAYAYAFKDKASEIHCFEPNQEAFDCLVHNLGKINNTFLFNYAVGEEGIPYVLNTEDDNIGAAFIKESPESSLRTISIDSMYWIKVDFILMDCEGSELAVLKGAEKTINNFHPIMVIEINDGALQRNNVTRQDVFKWLEDHDYTFRNIYETEGFEYIQMDIICFPKS